MNETINELRSVVVERELAHPVDRIWRALTQPHLISEWLMQSEFRPMVGHRFGFRAEWGTVDCEVRTIEPHRSLSYTWGDSRLESVVTWTLIPKGAGTLLRMEQVGFRADQPRYFQGARDGWPVFLDRLEELLGRID